MTRTLAILVVMIGILPHVSANEILRDNFNRTGKLHDSSTSDGKYTWSVFPEISQKNYLVKHNRMDSQASDGVMFVNHEDMRQHNFDLSFDFTYLSNHHARRLSVNYRLQSKSGKNRLSDRGHSGGYVLYIERPSRSILRLLLFKDSHRKKKPDTLIAKTDVVTANRWDITTRIHLHVTGNHHEIYINDAEKSVIDVRDDEYDTPGWWNIADGGFASWGIDNLRFSSGASLTVGSSQVIESKELIGDLKPLYPIHYTGRVTPAPQQVLSEWETYPLSSNDFQVMIANDAHNAITLARSLLLQRIEDQSRSLGHSASNSSGKKLVIYLGELESEFIQKVASSFDLDLNEIVLKSRGYIIRRKGNKILAAGVGHRGTFYAATTLYQSIGTAAGELILRHADLNDWPVWNWYQSVFVAPDMQGLLWMALHKIPGISLQQRDEWRNIRPDGKPQYPGKWADWEQILRVHQEFDDKFDLLDRQLLLNIYAAKPREMPILDISNDKHIDQLINTCRFAADMGIEHIMIAADDWTPAENGRYVLPYPDERIHFQDSAGRAHGTLMRQLHQALKPRFHDLEFSFVPAPYSIYQHSIPVKPSHQRYLRDLATELPRDINLLWTGPKIRSLWITRDDFLRWEDYVDNQRSYLWDNSAGPEPIKRWETVFYEGFAADSQGMIFINGGIFGKPYSLAFAINSGDYLWNPQAYQVGQSFRDAAEKMYGIGTATTAEQFISVYSSLKIFRKNPKKTSKLLNKLVNLARSMQQQGWPMKMPIKKLKALQSTYKAM